MRYALLALTFMTLSAQTCEGPIPTEVVNETFTFAVIDSMESRWSPWWQEHGYNLHAAFDEIKARDVDFVISTGDNLACNPTHPAEAARCYLELRGAMAHYLPDTQVYYIGGNHDLSSYPNQAFMDLWELYVAPQVQEFTHKGTHFVLLTDGQYHFEPAPQEVVDDYCSLLTPGTLSFRHMHRTGSGDSEYRYERYECEQGVVPYVIAGHYNQWYSLDYNGTTYKEIADSKDGNVLFVTVTNGEVVNMEEFTSISK